MKFAFQPTDNHRFSIIADLYKQTSKGHDFSYTLKPNTQYTRYGEKELRHTNDKVERKNIAFVYENFTETPFWDTLKITYSHQKLLQQQELTIIAMEMKNATWSIMNLGYITIMRINW